MPDVLGRAGRRLEKSKPDPRVAWRRTARPDQLLPEGDWRIFYLQGGRGSGKTRSGAQGLAELIQEDPEPGEWGIVAPTYRDAWTTCVEGESGILVALGTSIAEIKEGKSALIKHAWRTYGEIIFRDGSIIRVDSANDGALRVQGKNLKGAWCDEIGLWAKWETAWDESIAFAVRQGVSKIIATGTPKVSRPAAKLIRRLIRTEPNCIVRRLRTIDNAANLSKAFFRSVVARATGTRLEKQELEGVLLDDVENALWTRDLLAEIQVTAIPGRDTEAGATGLTQVTVGVDPSDGTEDSDECAYTISGIAGDRHLYVVECWGGRIGAVPFLKRAVKAAQRWNGRIILEKNHGGAYLVETLEQVMRDLGIFVPYEVVHASQAKRTRAEPVAALYERGVVRHATGYDGEPRHAADTMVDLEDQMVTYTGASNERSPDRLDSLTWSMYPHLNNDFDFSGIPHKPGVREYEIQRRLAEMTVSREDKIRRRLAGTHETESYDQGQDGWDIDSFAPQNDDGRRDRPRVHAYR